MTGLPWVAIAAQTVTVLLASGLNLAGPTIGLAPGAIVRTRCSARHMTAALATGAA